MKKIKVILGASYGELLKKTLKVNIGGRSTGKSSASKASEDESAFVYPARGVKEPGFITSEDVEFIPNSDQLTFDQRKFEKDLLRRRKK